MIGEFEAHWPARLFLANCGAVERVSAGGDILDTDGHDIAAAELAVDREVEEGQIAFAVLDLKPRPDGPNLAGPQRWLWADELPLVPGRWPHWCL